jgi:hypothetical protein
MAIRVIGVCNKDQRELLAPHIEAIERAERMIALFAPEPGARFNRDTLTYYVEDTTSPTEAA